METSLGESGDQSSYQMNDIIDDDIEITLESPREQKLAGEEMDTNGLTLFQAVDKLAEGQTMRMDHSEKQDIPTIVITDINNDRGDQADSAFVGIRDVRVSGDFTAIMDETPSKTEHIQEKEIEFSNIVNDASVRNEIEDNNINADKHSNKHESTDKQDKTTSADLGNASKSKTIVLRDYPKTDSETPVKQQAKDTEFDMRCNSEMRGDSNTQGTKEDTNKYVTVTAGKHESNTELEEGSVSLDSILVREKTDDDSDPDEFDFELPTPKTNVSPSKQVTFNDTEKEKKSSAKGNDDLENKPQAVALETNKDQPIVPPGNKPIAVIKPTTQAAAAGSKVKYTEEDERHEGVLESAQAEWDRVTTITAGFSDRGTVKGLEPVVVETTPTMSPHEMIQYLKTANFSQFKSSIRTSVERSGFSAFVHFLFGPPKLNRALLEERDRIFCTAASPLNNEDPYHTRTLQTIYRCLTGSKFDCPRTGSHWEEIGFQGSDPATDLRGAGLLGLVNLLHFLKDQKSQGIASDIYRLSLHPTQNFPFCVMGINMSRITLQTLREELLNRECNKRGDVLGVVNDFYVGLYLSMYQVWKSQGKTIQDSGYVIKEIELNAKKNPKQVLRNLDEYMNKKKTVIVAEKSPDTGADNFLSLCEDKT